VILGIKSVLHLQGDLIQAIYTTEHTEVYNCLLNDIWDFRIFTSYDDELCCDVDGRQLSVRILRPVPALGKVV